MREFRRGAADPPHKIHASRTGGYTNVELFFDGKTFTVEDKKGNVYVQAEAPGSVDQLIDKLRGELGVDMPGADISRTPMRC